MSEQRPEPAMRVTRYWVVKHGQAHSSCWYAGSNGKRSGAYRFADRGSAVDFCTASRLTHPLVEAWVVRIVASPSEGTGK